MKKPILTIVVVAAGAAACLLLQHRSQARLREGEALLREQSNQLSTLTAEHERLSKMAAWRGPGTNDYGAELAKLRGEAEALKKQINDLGRTVAASQSSPPSHPLAGKTPHTPEYYQQLRQLAGSRPTETMEIGRAFGEYAFDHQNQCPTSLDQLTPYLANNNAKLSGSNQYEIIYQGSLDQLKNLPWSSIAVVRDAEPWPGPEGIMMRTYGFPGGNSQMVIDNLQPWLSQHVITPLTAGPPGQ